MATSFSKIIAHTAKGLFHCKPERRSCISPAAPSVLCRCKLPRIRCKIAQASSRSSPLRVAFANRGFIALITRVHDRNLFEAQCSESPLRFCRARSRISREYFTPLTCSNSAQQFRRSMRISGQDCADTRTVQAVQAFQLCRIGSVLGTFLTMAILRIWPEPCRPPQCRSQLPAASIPFPAAGGADAKYSKSHGTSRWRIRNSRRRSAGSPASP